MSRHRKLLARVGITGLVAGVALVGVPSIASATTPAWQTDTNSVGSIVFYNAAGQQITGGLVSSSPIAAYAQGTTQIRSGDTKAALYGYLPINGTAPGSWSGEILSNTATVYPNASAPGALGSSTLPLATGSASDLSIANLEADYPNTDTSTDGYAGVYQLRLETTQSGQPANAKYDSVAIQITGTGSTSTWSVLYPTPTLASTTTTVTTTQSSPQVAGTSVQINAAISPAAPGTVQFEDGTTPIGSPVTVSGGSASITTSTLSIGSHTLKAVFTPAQFAAYSGSTGTDASPFVVSQPPAAATTTALSVNPTSAAADSPVALTANISLTSGGAAVSAGHVDFYDNGSTLLGSAPLNSSGVATLTYGTFAQGAHSIAAQYVPADATVDAASTSSAVAFTATAPQYAPSAGSVDVTIPAGTLTISTPYSTSNPFQLGAAALDGSDSKFVATGAFGSQSAGATGNDGGVTITDTRAGNQGWTASANVTDFADGNHDKISGQDLSLTNVTAVQIQGNALQASSVATTNYASAALNGAPYAPGATGSDGLGGAAQHAFAWLAPGIGIGTVDVDGILTLDAPTSTVAGDYTATLTFTII